MIHYGLRDITELALIYQDIGEGEVRTKVIGHKESQVLRRAPVKGIGIWIIRYKWKEVIRGYYACISRNHGNHLDHIVIFRIH